MNLYSITSLISIALSLILGITVFSIAPRRFMGKAFLLGILFLIVIQVTFFIIFLQKESYKIELYGKIAISSFCLILPTWVMISQIFGRVNYVELLKRRKWYLSSLYALGLLCLVLTWTFDIFSVALSFPKDLFVIRGFGKCFLIFMLLNTILILINFENTLRLTKIYSRKGKKVPFYGLMGAFLFLVYAISQMLMYSRISGQLVLAGLFIIILTSLILIFYSIKYGLTQFEVSVGREVFYSSAMVFIVGVYLLVIGLVGKIVQFAGGSVNLFLSFLAALLVFCLFLATLVSKSLKARIKQFIDRNFYKNRYDYREQWGRFSESLSAVLNLDEVLTTIIENITNIFSANKAAILLNDESTGILVVRKRKNMPGLCNIKFYHNSNLIDWLHRHGEAVELNTLISQAEQIGITDMEQQNLSRLQAAIIVPMIIQTKFMGIFIIGEKNPEGSYSKEDFDLLETLANQSSVAILNAQLNEDLLISREMESFHKLSSFVLHDLRNSTSMLSMIINNAERNWDNQQFQKDMLITISNTVNKMKSLISKISSLPDNLEPRRQMVQINDMIKKVLDETKIEELNSIKLKDDLQQLPMLSVDPDQIQKVIENLVINALEALPRGGSLKISTKLVHNHRNRHAGNGRANSENSFAEIDITDTGSGMTEDFIQNHLFKPFQTTKKKGLGIGLYQCKEIITAHGGTIEVKSQENEGTSFKILLPTSNGHPIVKDSNKTKLNHAIFLN